jgi:hypothetical protein
MTRFSFATARTALGVSVTGAGGQRRATDDRISKSYIQETPN